MDVHFYNSLLSFTQPDSDSKIFLVLLEVLEEPLSHFHMSQ